MLIKISLIYIFIMLMTGCGTGGNKHKIKIIHLGKPYATDIKNLLGDEYVKKEIPNETVIVASVEYDYASIVENPSVIIRECSFRYSDFDSVDLRGSLNVYVTHAGVIDWHKDREGTIFISPDEFEKRGWIDEKKLFN